MYENQVNILVNWDIKLTSYCRNEVDMLVVCLGNMKVNKEKNQDKVVI